MRYFILTLLTVLCTASLAAQEFVYKAGFFGFFDNREYFNEYVNDQTIFGSRISGELGYAFNKNSRFMAGIDYLYEFGSKGEWTAPDFIAYYRGQNEHARIFLGAFPRYDKISMPLAILNDTFSYYRPNLEGILIDYRSNGFYHNIWIDWTGRQSIEKQESFLLGFSGYLKKGVFMYQHHFVMSHLAHSLKQNVEEHIRDNAGFSLMPGLDFSHRTFLDSLTVSAGLLGSYDRLRNVYGFQFPIGFLGEVKAIYRHIGLQATLYAGESQVITSGDGLYQSDFYGRADAFYQFINENINSRLQFSFHFLPGVTDVSMSLVIRASLDGAFRRHQSN